MAAKTIEKRAVFARRVIGKEFLLSLHPAPHYERLRTAELGGENDESEIQREELNWMFVFSTWSDAERLHRFASPKKKPACEVSISPLASLV